MNNPRRSAPRQGAAKRDDNQPMTQNEQISQRGNAQQRMRELLETIRERKAEIIAVLPFDIAFEKFEAVLNMAIRRDPDLLNCYGPSVIKAAIQSAYDGLLPDGREAVILVSNNKVPGTGGKNGTPKYRKEARYQSMVYGVRKKLVDAGAVTFIDGKVVFSKEHFLHEEGLDPKLEHIPVLDEKERGDPIATYSVARLPSGEKVFDVMSKVDVMAAREVAKTKSVWDGPFRFEMWKKTVIRRLSKALPTKTPVRDAEALDMYPEFAPAQPSIPAPARPTREDFAQLGHHQEVGFDLAAFEGGYDDGDAIYEGEGGENDVRASQAAQTSTGAQESSTGRAGKAKEEQAGDNRSAQIADEGAKVDQQGLQVPKDADGWDLWADELRSLIPELASVDAANQEWERQRPLIDKAPKHLATAVNEAFTDQISDLSTQPSDAADASQGSLDMSAGEEN